MISPDQIAGLAAALVAGLLAFGLCEAAARMRFALDPVSERSNHRRPVPRIGGAGVLVGIGGAALLLSAAGLLTVEGGQLLLLAGLAGLLGLADDLLGLSPMAKLAGLVAVAIPAVILAGPVAELPLPFFGWTALPPPIGYAMAAFWVLAIANVMNFMDGLNGLVGCFVVASLTASALLIGEVGFALLAVQVAVLGFLLTNIFGGRVFLGDGGSLALGLIIGTVPLFASGGGKGFWLMALIALPLIMDVSLTLARRAGRGARLHEAHREHFYQRVKAKGWSHQAAAFGVLLTGLAASLVAWWFWEEAEMRPLAYWASAVVIAFLWGTTMLVMLAAKGRAR